MRLLSKQLVINFILMILIIMIDMLPQFIEQEYEFSFLDWFLENDIGVQTGCLIQDSLLGRDEK